ncbi:MAG: BadF/BadG/BcrA/BcrD ATPase family protein [Candidatus Dormibacteraceae bacterium]
MFIGVDAGATNTLVVLEDGQRNRVEERLPTISPISLEVSKAEANLDKLCRLIAECQGDEPCSVCIGSAALYQVGVARSRAQMIKCGSKAGIRGRVVVVDDSVLPLFGPPLNGIGVAVIAGTGSVVLGRDHTNQVMRLGGYDYVFSDEGSAFDVARRALRAAAHSWDRVGPPTALVEQASLFYGCDIPNIGGILSMEPFPKTHVADFARFVSTVADSGDAVAITILRDAAIDLADLAVVAFMSLQDVTQLVVSGGVAMNSSHYSAAFEFRIQERVPGVVVSIVGTGVESALALARQIASSGLPTGFEQFLHFSVELDD